jgi:hypothetical protein
LIFWRASWGELTGQPNQGQAASWGERMAVIRLFRRLTDEIELAAED